MENAIRIAGIEPESIVDGPGIRYVIFTQGCFRNCPGCHNPQTHDPAGGHDMAIGDILSEIRENPLISGITFSGGEPFLQAERLIPLAKTLRAEGYHIMAFSGYAFEELARGALPGARELLRHIDILVDGAYVQELRDPELSFRGSSNQRLIDVPKMLKKQTQRKSPRM